MRTWIIPLVALGLVACNGGRESGVNSVTPELPGAGDAEQRADDLGLLGSKRGRHVWNTYCASQPDSAPLPVDPRSMIQPGVNADRAVYFNAYWDDCRVNLPAEKQRPQTCGEFRAARDAGFDFLVNELPASAGAMSAEDFRMLWQKWGFDSKPDNFDQLYTLRYGLNHAPFDNPYPLEGEDPTLTDGGSGQLPLGLRQLKDEQGQWTGMIGTAACFQCHGGQIGDVAAGETAVLGLNSLGLGNNNADVLMLAQDNSPLSQLPGPLSSAAGVFPGLSVDSLFNIGIKQRGQNNAVGAFELLVTLLDFDSLGFTPNLAKTITAGLPGSIADSAHPLAHTQDTPPWWNMGSRPRKFFDAGVSNDSTRIIMAAGPGEISELFTLDGKHYRERIAEYDQKLANYFLSLESPVYPAQIDENLARQGAILFHSKDLWAAPGNAERPRPDGGNGSCASCHGAYAPMYVNDPSYLEDPIFEGIAAHISPLEVIGTDRARSDMLTMTLREGWDVTYWAFPDGVEGWTAPEDKDPVTELLDDMLPVAIRPKGLCGWEKGVIGYQAPPLYGVWATAPYLHNGSVPTLEALLDSSQRHAIWQRKLQTDGPVTGFDQRLSVAFDFDAVGWKHDALSCSDIPGSELLNCNPLNEEGPSVGQMVQNYINGLIAWAGVVNVSDPTPGGFDKRLVYDSRILGNGNAGHEFTDVLTERERAAIIEYLKTL